LISKYKNAIYIFQVLPFYKIRRDTKFSEQPIGRKVLSHCAYLRILITRSILLFFSYRETSHFSPFTSERKVARKGASGFRLGWLKGEPLSGWCAGSNSGLILIRVTFFRRRCFFREAARQLNYESGGSSEFFISGNEARSSRAQHMSSSSAVLLVYVSKYVGQCENAIYNWRRSSRLQAFVSFSIYKLVSTEESLLFLSSRTKFCFKAFKVCSLPNILTLALCPKTPK